MSEKKWTKIEHPKQQTCYLGLFVTVYGLVFRREFFYEDKKYYSFDHSGECVEIPCPDYYREIDDLEPDWMND